VQEQIEQNLRQLQRGFTMHAEQNLVQRDQSRSIEMCLTLSQTLEQDLMAAAMEHEKTAALAVAADATEVAATAASAAAMKHIAILTSLRMVLEVARQYHQGTASEHSGTPRLRAVTNEVRHLHAHGTLHHTAHCTLLPTRLKLRRLKIIHHRSRN